MESKIIDRNLYRALRKTGVKKENISLKARFIDDFHFDSCDWTIFTYYLENICRVNVDESTLKKLYSVNDTLNFLKQRG